MSLSAAHGHAVLPTHECVVKERGVAERLKATTRVGDLGRLPGAVSEPHPIDMTCSRLPVAAVGIAALSLCLTGPALAAPQRDSDQTPLATSDIASRVTPSVVTLTTPTGTGSGVIVDPSGVLITSLHVIQGDTEVAVELANGDVYDDVAVVDVDERRDLVLLKIKAFNLTPASLGNSDDVQVGEDVVLVGSPRGLDLTVSEGVVSAVRDSGDGYRLLQTSAPASPGSSGGGMFNSFGELVGIVTSQITDGQNLNFAVPINYARGLMATEADMTLAELADHVGDGNEGTYDISNTVASSDFDPASITRLAALVEASGTNFEQYSDSMWITSYSGGDNLEEVYVMVSLYSDTMVLVRGVVDDPETELAAPQLMKLLELNYELDLAKVSFDSAGSIWPMAEAELRMLDGPGLALIADAVALATDRTAGLLDNATDSTGTAVVSDLTRSESAGGESLNLLQGHIAIHYDPSEWTESTPATSDITKQYFHSSGELYVAVIAERVAIPVEAMLRIALDNARDVAPDVSATRRGSRLVNGTEVLFQEYQGTVDGISIAYLGHFYSDSNGTVQILGWTTSNLIEAHRDTVAQFVAGFVVEQ